MTVDLRPADLTRGDVITDPGQPSRLCTVDHVIVDGTRVLVGTISGAQHAMGARVPVRVWNRYEAHGLTVNEAGVLATRTGAQWWSDFLLAHRDTGRVQTLWASLGGAVCFVACDTRSDAAWLHQHAQDRGIPARFLTITTRTHRVEPDDFIGLAEGPIIVGVDDEHPEARSA